MSARASLTRIAALCAGIWLLAGLTAFALPDGADLLRKTLKAEPKTRYQGIYVTEIARGPRPVVARIEIKRDAGRGFRVEFLAPPRMAGRGMVDDGTHFLERFPGNKPARVGPSRAGRPLMILFPERPALRRLADDMTVKVIGKTRVLGREAWEVEISPLREDGPRRRLWIDREHLIPLRSEVVKPSGEVLFKSAFERIDFSPTLSARDFSVTPPADARPAELPGGAGAASSTLEEVRNRSPFPVAIPKRLPPGFRLEEAGLRRWGAGGVVIRLRYSDGFAAFTLFESRSARPPKSLPARVRSKTLGGVNITMVSNNLPPEAARRIFDSVR